MITNEFSFCGANARDYENYVFFSCFEEGCKSIVMFYGLELIN